jgi:hypothetical protein
MDILARRQTWLHTYFVTDCVRLSTAQGREITTAMLTVLRQHHIVYGIHFAESRHEPGLRIVLECIPQTAVLAQIETVLRQIVAPIPAKPPLIRVSQSAPESILPGASSPPTASWTSESGEER